MNYGLVPLHPEHLDKLPLPEGLDKRAYFSPDSVALCLLVNGEPVFAGGLVSLDWHRAEAWLLPTPYFRSHIKTCLKEMRREIPRLALQHGFRRVQATCMEGTPGKLFRHLGFHFEGIMHCFGPHGENCYMYSRIFEVSP